jgi:DNA-binding transcriptional regulator YiaG
MSRKRLRSYEAGPVLGLRSVKVRNVPALVCRRCKNFVLDGGLLDSLHERLLVDILCNGRVLAGDEARFIRKAPGLSQASLALRLGVHRVTIARWESGDVPIDGPTSVAIRALAVLIRVGKPMKPHERDRLRQSFEQPLARRSSTTFVLDAVG